MNPANHRQWYYQRALISLMLVVFASAACGRGPDFELYGKGEIQTGDKAQVGVRVKNPPGELRFRWRAARGRCEPQESNKLSSTYIAPLEPGEDRITVEVFHESKPIFLDEVLVKVVRGPTSEPRVAHSPASESPSMSATPVPRPSPLSTRLTIRITQVPPCDPMGGPDTSADITGEVSGANSGDVRVVVYARTNYWYVQPLIAAPFTEIEQDGRWGTWTHTGSEYAALLVRPSYDPPARIHTLPKEGGDVLAVTKVKGRGC